jgi:tetratricopeptide (TPR) repeat protein
MAICHSGSRNNMRDFQNKTWLRRTMVWQTATVLAAGSVFWPLPIATAEAKSSDKNGEHATDSERKSGSKKHGHASTHKGKSATGLDATTLDLVNNGNWKEVVPRLEQLCVGDTAAGNMDAWLAFGYLFNNDCVKMDNLCKKLGVTVPSVATFSSTAAGSSALASPTSSGSSPSTAATSPTASGSSPSTAATSPTASGVAPSASASTSATASSSSVDAAGANPYAVVIAAFSQSCHGHADEARKTLAGLPRSYGSDVVCNFALAAVAGKQGLAGEAAAFLERTLELAPDFAWGYRTLAFLQQRWLKQPAKAEDSYLKALAVAPELKEARDAVVDLRLARNDFDGAVDISREAIAADAKDPGNNYRLAQIYIQQWRLREAQQQLDDAIALDPQNAKFYRARAAVKRFRGNVNDAILDQQKAVALGQDKTFELVELSAMNALAGNRNRAADNLQEALKLDPDNQSAHDRLVALLEEEGRSDELVVEYKRALEKKPKDERLHLSLGSAYVKLGKLSEAKAQFVEAQNLDQSDPEPHRQMGALYIKEKNFEKAAKEYTFVLNINPTSVQDLVALGNCYSQNSDYMQAEAAYVTALALQQLLVQTSGPDRLEVMRSLANLLFNEGRYSDAASQFESILAMDKAGSDQSFDAFRLAQAKALRDLNGSSAKNLVEALAKLSDAQKSEQTSNVIDTLLKANRPELAQALIDSDTMPADKLDDQHKAVRFVEQADLQRIKGDFGKAIESASKATSLKTLSSADLSAALVCLAQAQLDKGDLESAQKSAENASTAYAKNFAAYVIAAKLSLKKHNPSLAITQAKKALELNPYDAKAYLVLGEAQTQTGQTKEAAVNYRKAAELYPSLLEAHKLLLDSLRKLSLTEEAQKEAEQIAQMEKQQ